MSPLRRLEIWNQLLLFRKSVDPFQTTSSKPLSTGSYYSFRCNLASFRIPFSDLKRAEAFCPRMNGRQCEHTLTSKTWIWNNISTGFSSQHYATKSYGVHGGNLHTFLNSAQYWIDSSASLPPPVVLPIENYWKLTSTIHPVHKCGWRQPWHIWFNHYAS
jgi:hypothetical protein